MQKNLNVSGFVTLLALAALALAAVPAHAQEAAAAPEKGEPLSAGSPFSCAASARQAGRGFTNIALCWLELPYQIKAHLLDQRNDRPTTVFVPLYDFVAGTVHGTVATAERLVGGTIELITSPIPAFEPIMNPPYPPYLFIDRHPAKVAAPTPAPAATPEAPVPPPVPQANK